MKTHHSFCAHSCGLSKAAQKSVIYICYLEKMQCFRTQISIPSPNCNNRILGIYKKTLKSCLNVFCLSEDPLSLRHKFGSCDAAPNTKLTRTTSLCKLTYGVDRQKSMKEKLAAKKTTSTENSACETIGI